jgi:hypothetical protein
MKHGFSNIFFFLKHGCFSVLSSVDGEIIAWDSCRIIFLPSFPFEVDEILVTALPILQILRCAMNQREEKRLQART